MLRHKSVRRICNLLYEILNPHLVIYVGGEVIEDV